MRNSHRRYGKTEDDMVARIDRKRAVLVALDQRERPQDTELALLALESEGVLRYPERVASYPPRSLADVMRLRARCCDRETWRAHAVKLGYR